LVTDIPTSSMYFFMATLTLILACKRSAVNWDGPAIDGDLDKL
jgi:hypothetical protein